MNVHLYSCIPIDECTRANFVEFFFDSVLLGLLQTFTNFFAYGFVASLAGGSALFHISAGHMSYLYKSSYTCLNVT